MENIANKVTIYGVKSGESYRYIGKLGKIAKDNIFNNSDVHYQYTNDRIRSIFTCDIANNDVNVLPIKIVLNDQWYNEKLKEVLAYYNKNHPLVNAQWMLDGKRGYWEGKERDKFTLSRLSESKFKKVYQYDDKGDLVKIWRSGKAAATMIFKDYQIIKGAGTTELYNVLGRTILKNKFSHGYYWFWEEDLKKIYTPNPIPRHIYLYGINLEQHKKRSIIRKHTVVKNMQKYCVHHLDTEGHVFYTYKNTNQAAFMLKTTVHIIQKICRGTIKNNYYILKYGKKSLQPVNEKYPDYVIEPLRKS